MSTIRTQNIKVVVRVRPFGENESKKPLLDFQGSNVILIKDKKYTFDHVFRDNATQKDVYKNVVTPMVRDIFSGYSCTIFAYGQTGSGKTFTMLGRPSQKVDLHNDPTIGCIPRAVVDIFKQVQALKNKLDYAITVSFVELYNEEVRDMLSDNNGTLNIFSDPRTKGNVYIENLKELPVYSTEDLLKYLEFGMKKRHTASTLMNQYSSRSHTVFTINVNTKQTTITGEEICKTGKLNLVDLAGSENIGKSGAKEMRALEASNINKSLLTLGRVIKALVEKTSHVPYRESKLTRILQDSLGGTTKTCIIATVAPGSNYHEETLSTLDYAFRARTITNCPKVNQNLSESHLLRQLNKEIQRVKGELEAARSKAKGFYLDENNYNRLKTDLDDHEEICLEQEKTMTNLTEQLSELEHFKEHFTRQCKNLNEAFEKTKETLKYYKKSIAEKRLEVAQEHFVLQNYTNPERQLKLINNTKSLLDFKKQYLDSLNQLRSKLITTNTAEADRCEIISKILNTMKEYSEKPNGIIDTEADEQQLFRGIVKSFIKIENDLHEIINNDESKSSFMINIENELVSSSNEYYEEISSIGKTFSEQINSSTLCLNLKNFVTEISSELEEINNDYNNSTTLCEENWKQTEKEFNISIENVVQQIDHVKSIIQQNHIQNKQLLQFHEDKLEENKNKTELLKSLRSEFDKNMNELNKLGANMTDDLVREVERINQQFGVIINRIKQFLDARAMLTSNIFDDVKLFVANILQNAAQFRDLLRDKLQNLESFINREKKSYVMKLIFCNQEKCMELAYSLSNYTMNIDNDFKKMHEIISNQIQRNEEFRSNTNETITLKGVNVMEPITRSGNTPKAKQNENLNKESFIPRETVRQRFREKFAKGEVKLELDEAEFLFTGDSQLKD